MEFLEHLSGHLGIVSGIIIALGVITTTVVKTYKFVHKVNDEIEFIETLKQREAVEKLDYVEQLEEVDVLEKVNQIDQILHKQNNMEKNIESLILTVQTLAEKVDGISTKLDELCIKFDKHCAEGEKTTDLLINQCRFTLETAMKNSIRLGYADIDEKRLIGSLFTSYQNNNGNFGIKDIFDVYKNLPPAPSETTEIIHNSIT